VARPELHEAAKQNLQGPQGEELACEIRAATVADFASHEADWKPQLRQVRALDAEWDWSGDFERDEAPSNLRETYALTSPNGRVQGLMSLEILGDRIYIERLAIAPWNRGAEPEARGIGGALLFHAIRRSMARGLGGYLALHSLEDPKTIDFYRVRMKMAEMGTEQVDGSKMRYFELVPAAARALIKGAS